MTKYNSSRVMINEIQVVIMSLDLNELITDSENLEGSICGCGVT